MCTGPLLQTLPLKEEDALFEAGKFYDSNPVALQRAVWWFLSLKFGFRAREEIWKLRCGDVQLRPQNAGQEGLVWLAELGTNTDMVRREDTKEHSNQRLCHQYCETSLQFLPEKIPQSPASGNERTRITILLVKKFLSTAAKNAGFHREGKKVTIILSGRRDLTECRRPSHVAPILLMYVTAITLVIDRRALTDFL